MNPSQFTSILRILLAAGGPIGILLVAHGISADQLSAATNWIIAGVPIVLGFWGWWQNSHANLALTASKIDGVKVVVTEEAPEAVQAVAKDTSEATKNVVMVSPPDAKPLGRKTSPR